MEQNKHERNQYNSVSSGSWKSSATAERTSDCSDGEDGVMDKARKPSEEYPEHVEWVSSSWSSSQTSSGCAKPSSVMERPVNGGERSD